MLRTTCLMTTEVQFKGETGLKTNSADGRATA